MYKRQDPEYVAVVVLEEAGFGGQVAAPVIRRYFETIALERVPAFLSQAEKDEIAKDQAATSSLNQVTEMENINEENSTS